MDVEFSGKLYYSISEVAEMTDLEPSVLRYWEGEFSQLRPNRPKKSKSGNRMYREKDVRLILEIKRLTREEGYTLAGAKKRIQEASYKSATDAGKRTPETASPPQEETAPASVSNGDPAEVIAWVRSELRDIQAMLEED